MSKIRVVIELDADNPAVQGMLLWRLSNAAQALHRACESANPPHVYPDMNEWAWTERPIVTRERETIGRFIVEKVQDGIWMTDDEAIELMRAEDK